MCVMGYVEYKETFNIVLVCSTVNLLYFKCGFRLTINDHYGVECTVNSLRTHIKLFITFCVYYVSQDMFVSVKTFNSDDISLIF